MPPIVTITSTADGKKLDPVAERLSLEIRREVNRVPEAEVKLLDGSVAKRKFELSDLGFFEPGKAIAIAAREGEGKDVTLFEGLVVRHSIETGANGSTLKVELKDAAFKLTRQRKCVVHRKKTDEAAIRKVIGDAKLKAGTLTATKATHEELIQYLASDWDFLVSRAEASGLVVDVDRGTVSMHPVVPGKAAKARLEHGLDDVELELGLDAAEQWAAVTSLGWDVQKLAATAPSEAKQPNVKVGNVDAGEIAKKLGGATCALVHPAILPQGELAAWADGHLARTRQGLLRGRATTRGRTDLAPLDLIELAGVGARFNGQALISGVTHRIDHGGWRTELQLGLSPEAHARRPDFADLPAGGLLPPVQGLHVGVVGEFEADPLGEHRVKVLLSVLDKKQGAIWARVARPDAGKKRGQVFWPEPGDEVVVGFIHGDPRQAIVLGALHGSANPPPEAAGPPSKANDKRAIVSKGGTVIAFDDAKKSVRIETPGKNKVEIDDAAKSITLADQHGNKIIMDAKGITLKSAADFTIDAASGKVVIKGSSVDVQ